MGQFVMLHSALVSPVVVLPSSSIMKATMKALCFLILLAVYGGHHVEGRRDRDRHGRQPPNYMLLVFGDSFVDAGNLPRTEKSMLSRSWYYPYGMSYNNRPTGRFSDGMVQSDFVAKILGLDESPPASRTLGPNDDVDPSGVNFAVGGTGVLTGTPTLGQQVDQLASLVENGVIRHRDLDHNSVALISTSAARDYSHIKGQNTFDEMMSLSRSVTDEIKVVVRRLLEDVGVAKVMVNTMPPMGCMPWESVYNNHTSCEARGNMMSDVHNAALRQKLAEFKDDVLLLDLNSAFNGFVQDGDADGQFTSGLNECCVAPPGGYCGQVDNWGRRQYGLCDDPENRFFWDYMHPTQAAWKAVVNILKDPIKDFLRNDDDY